MSDFEVGDLVQVVDDHWIWTDNLVPEDAVFIVIPNKKGDEERRLCRTDTMTVELNALVMYPKDFKRYEPRIEAEETTRIDTDNALSTRLPASIELGVYRPNLEDRKVGKVRVELVDEGFPLALRELAKVMTWAQTAKGYKDHDWQNLPNAEVALAAATSRHRTDHVIQRRWDDLPALKCVDGESEILHKAHEAFGVLAQLELILRGKFE